MSTINKKNIIKVSLIVLFIILVVVLILLQSISENPDNFSQDSNIAILKGFSTVKDDNEKKEENVVDKEAEELTIYNSSNELINLNQSGWDFQNTNINGDYESDNINYYYQGFTLTREKNKIIRILFNEDYENEVISGIYVGMDFEDVKSILGEPKFENIENNMIGYVTQNLFVCIYEDEIAVYQNEYYYNKDLEEMILKYYNKTYSGNANEFSRYIRNNYEDFVFSSDEQRNIYLTSEIRGIVIKLDDNIKVYLYKNYDSTQLLEKNMLENIEISEQYMAELMENERILEQ